MIPHLLAGLVLLGQAVQAEPACEPLTYDRVTLSASATREVQNDTLVGVLAAQREGGDPRRVADEVNQAVRSALERARQVEGVKVQTLDYHTSPVYREQQVVGWRTSQALRVESRDAAALGSLLAELQRSLVIQSIGYAVSPERRREVEEELIRESVNAFGKRAALVAVELGRPGYRLVALEVDTGGVEPPRPFALGARAAAMPAEIAAPALEAGTQTVTATARGTVEMARP
jgi:predicted secreted protein